jgi:hypothetical protein
MERVGEAVGARFPFVGERGDDFLVASSYDTSVLKITSADALVVTSELYCTTSKPSGLDSVQTVSGLAAATPGRRRRRPVPPRRTA